VTPGLTLEIFSNGDLAGPPVHATVTDRMQLTWFGEDDAFVRFDSFSARLTGSLVVPESGAYRLSLIASGVSRLILDGATLLEQRGEEPAEGAASTFTEPAVDVELTAGRAYPVAIEYASVPGPRWRQLRFGCQPVIPANAIAQAAALAAQSDVAIVVVGLTNEWEGEGADRPDMELPGNQAALIERVAAANPNTVVVLNAGSPVRMPWLDRVAAVLQVWYGGQESGHGLADVLFGDVDASGRLPTTFPRRLEDTPAFINYPGENGEVFYGEGLFVGYRYYDKRDLEPLFPFGYGLSYTAFAYRNLRVSAQTGGPEGRPIRVDVDVTNTGMRKGQEVIQIYISDVRSSLVRPLKELKAFAKVALAPGETRKVSLTLDEEAFMFYDPALKVWRVEPGEFEVLVGSSARDIHLTGRFS
jgi:beta-glucosidase